MTAGYRITRDSGGWRFELWLLPDRLLLTGNRYAGRQHCADALASLRIVCDSPLDTGEAPVRYPKYTVESTDSGFYRLVLRGRNGRRLAAGPESRSPVSAAAPLPDINRTARTAGIIR